MRIKDTEAVKEINYDLYIPVGNTTTNDPRHIDVGSLSDFVENNIKEKGTFATTEQLAGLSDAIVAEGENITFIDNKFTGQIQTIGQQITTLENQNKNFATTEQLNSVERGLQYLGDSLDQLEVDLNTYETWTFELEDGSTINKNVLINK